MLYYYLWEIKLIWRAKEKLDLIELKSRISKRFEIYPPHPHFRLAKRIGVSLYEVSAKTGINCDEAFMDLASAMRDRLLVSNMHSDSEDSDQFASAFHIDGVIADEKLINGKNTSTISCCSSAPSPTFV